VTGAPTYTAKRCPRSSVNFARIGVKMRTACPNDTQHRVGRICASTSTAMSLCDTNATLAKLQRYTILLARFGRCVCVCVSLVLILCFLLPRPMAAAASDIHWAIASLATTDSPATDVLVQGDGRAVSSRSTLLRITLNPSCACARGQDQCLYCAATRASRRARFNGPDYLSGDWKYFKIVTALAAAQRNISSVKCDGRAFSSRSTSLQQLRITLNPSCDCAGGLPGNRRPQRRSEVQL
jgi:hypothetical protein